MAISCMLVKTTAGRGGWDIRIFSNAAYWLLRVLLLLLLLLLLYLVIFCWFCIVLVFLCWLYDRQVCSLTNLTNNNYYYYFH
jgi:hypothetical protein